MLLLVVWNSLCGSCKNELKSHCWCIYCAVGDKGSQNKEKHATKGKSKKQINYTIFKSPFAAIVNQDTSTARYTQLRLEHITLKQFLPTILHPKPLLRERTSLWVSPGTITIYMGITSISYAMALANHNSAVYWQALSCVYWKADKIFMIQLLIAFLHVWSLIKHCALL